MRVARELGIKEGKPGRWASEGDGALSERERDELNRLRKENAELAMQGSTQFRDFRRSRFSSADSSREVPRPSPAATSA